MELVAIVISKDRVLINNDLYKRLKTHDGRYTPHVQRLYMQKWRKKQRLIEKQTDL